MREGGREGGREGHLPAGDLGAGRGEVQGGRPVPGAPQSPPAGSTGGQEQWPPRLRLFYPVTAHLSTQTFVVLCRNLFPSVASHQFCLDISFSSRPGWLIFLDSSRPVGNHQRVEQSSLNSHLGQCSGDLVRTKSKPYNVIKLTVVTRTSYVGCVVLGRAATTLRSIETQPFDWMICLVS